jgi:SH3-like domain-containing protein
MLSFVLPVFSFVLIQAASSGLCVNQDRAILRRGPGLGWPQTWEAVRYTPLKRLGKEKGWYRVQNMDGDIHWVREDLVTSSLKCAAVKTEFSNLRKGPGTHWPLHGGQKGLRHLPFRVMKTQQGWARLEDVQGDVVWASLDNLWIP